MKHHNQLRSGSLLTYVQMTLNIIVSIAYTPFMLRILGKSEYGLYSTVASTIAILSVLSLGFGGSYVRYYILYRKEKADDKIARLNGLFLIVFSVIGLIALACGLYLTFHLEMVFKTGLTDAEYHTARILMLLLTANLAVSFPMSVFSNIISAQEQFVFLKATEILRTVVSPLVTLPVLLVVQPKGASITLAAELQGLLQFRTPSHIVGILLNDCSESLYKTLRPMLEAETGLPVVGYLPHLPGCAIESRHLGLKTAGEISDLQQKLVKLADALVLDWAQLAVLTDRPAPAAPPLAAPCTPSVRIAVARDEAFCFAYAETLDALRDAGAELVFFSPLRDATLPENIGGLYLPGGYPELYARQLSENRALRTAIRDAVQEGLPTAAECGGFLYLGQTLEGTDSKVYPMAGVLPGSGHNTGRLVRFGYAVMTAKAGSMLFHAGEALPIHEFHHWDSSENGADFSVRKTEKRQWECGFANTHLYAGFPHLYWAGTALPRRFVQAAQHFLKHKG